MVMNNVHFYKVDDSTQLKWMTTGLLNAFIWYPMYVDRASHHANTASIFVFYAHTLASLG